MGFLTELAKQIESISICVKEWHNVGLMVRLESKGALKGWKYPVYTYIINDEIIKPLVNAGVARELISEADPNKLQPFDFYVHISTSTPMNPINRDIIIISIITEIEKGKEGGVSMRNSEVVSIPIAESKT